MYIHYRLLVFRQSQLEKNVLLQKMHWFRKQGDSPRLLSLSPIRNEYPTQDTRRKQDGDSSTGHASRSRLGIIHMKFSFKV